MNNLSSTFQKFSIVLPIILVLITCDSSSRSWSNPNDPDTDLDPSEWVPSNLQAQVLSDSEIKLTWEQQEENIAGFRLERSTGGSFTQIAELGADVTEYTDTGLSLDTDYTYRVKAFTEDNESGYVTSNTTNISFYITNLTATAINDQSIQLTWVDNCSFESGFRLERSTGGSFTQIAELEADVTEYTDTGLSHDTDYTYRVKAFTEVNESEYSNTAEMTLFYDCMGEFMGTAYENECGCVGGNTGLETDFCYGCTDPESENYDPIATIDDGSCYFTATDIDGNVYESVQIGDQVWTTTNLKTTHYRNGDAIPTGHSSSEWENLSTGAYAVYNDDESNADTYGYLYNWYAADDSRNIAPEGWHIPTDEEWMELEMALGMSESEANNTGWRGTDEGGKLKEEGTAHWNSPNTGATNESGFTALPGGYRGYDDGGYGGMGYVGYYWSSTEDSSDSAWIRRLGYVDSVVVRGYYYKRGGLSVRCIRTVE